MNCPGTHRVLALLRGLWHEAATGESDPCEVAAWRTSLDAIDHALAPGATHETIAAVLPHAAPYPVWGASALQELVEAERLGLHVLVDERQDGVIRWTVEPATTAEAAAE